MSNDKSPAPRPDMYEAVCDALSAMRMSDRHFARGPDGVKMLEQIADMLEATHIAEEKHFRRSFAIALRASVMSPANAKEYYAKLGSASD